MKPITRKQARKLARAAEGFRRVRKKPVRAIQTHVSKKDRAERQRRRTMPPDEAL